MEAGDEGDDEEDEEKEEQSEDGSNFEDEMEVVLEERGENCTNFLMS